MLIHRVARLTKVLIRYNYVKLIIEMTSEIPLWQALYEMTFTTQVWCDVNACRTCIVH